MSKASRKGATSNKNSRYHPYKKRLEEMRKKRADNQKSLVELTEMMEGAKKGLKEIAADMKHLRVEAAAEYGKVVCPKVTEIVDGWQKAIATLSEQGQKYVPATNLDLYGHEIKRWRKTAPPLKDDESYRKDFLLTDPSEANCPKKCYACSQAGTTVRWDVDEGDANPIEINANHRNGLNTVRIFLRPLEQFHTDCELKCGFRVQYWWPGLPGLPDPYNRNTGLPSTLTTGPSQPLCEQCLVACLSALRHRILENKTAQVLRVTETVRDSKAEKLERNKAGTKTASKKETTGKTSGTGAETVTCTYAWGVGYPDDTAFAVVENTLDRWDEAEAILGELSSGSDSDSDVPT